MKKMTSFIFLLTTCSLLMCACDPLTRHKITSTIFDGVPTLPSAEQYCRDYHIQATKEELAAAQMQKKDSNQGSKHPPFADKKCNNCHDKSTDSGFVVAKDALCAHCHKGFPSGNFLHGPAAVGACLKCHLPHSSDYPTLLVKPVGDVCDVCHAEARNSSKLHTTSRVKGIVCTDCHDPHGGNNRFFLR
ncbi:MAG TPA: cytochrome C [Desulfuromonadales bacterium]|nr:cytochrome C [Desulfuromonadales bacterium]